MAIRNSKQAWKIGDVVSVGFMKNLTVIEGPIAIKDFMPDIYRLRARNGLVYRFIPHHGIERE